MDIYLDTADFDQIRAARDLGVLRGVTTNPTHMFTAGHRDFRRAIQEICAIADVPVSAEVTAPDAGGMVEQAREIASWHPNVVVKMPTTPEGLRAMRVFSQETAGRRTPINATLIFSSGQAVAASLAGATYVSPFVGRLDAIGHEGIDLVRDVAQIFRVQDVPTRIISAALRNPVHVTESFKAGAHICTMGYAVLEQLLRHPLTEEAVRLFAADWERLQAAEVGAGARA